MAGDETAAQADLQALAMAEAPPSPELRDLLRRLLDTSDGEAL